jgi:hypothetical protein
MTSNQSSRKTRGKCRWDAPLEVKIVFIAAFDAQNHLNRAYEVILYAAERANRMAALKQAKCRKR